MKTGHKIWLVISGILLIVLGVTCIVRPAATLFTTAWLIGCFTLISGLSKLVFAFRTRFFLPNPGMHILSALFQIMIGFFFLGHKMFVALSLPMIFSLWVMTEGVVIAVQSFDYKKAGFGSWWALLLFGIAVVVLGCFGLRNIDVAGKALSWMIGIGVIVVGLAYLLAVVGVNRFEKLEKEATAN
jgi:uncharacterized membrane protein HdeD (DUF308 family)